MYHTRKPLRVPPPDTLASASVPISQDLAMAITGRTRRTVLRWIRDNQIRDPACRRLLQREIYGLMPGHAWRGWRTDRDALVSPDGEIWNVDQLHAAWIHPQLISELRQRCAILEAQLAEARAHAQEAAERPLTRLARLLGR